jgi:hypothetical protein
MGARAFPEILRAVVVLVQRKTDDLLQSCGFSFIESGERHCLSIDTMRVPQNPQRTEKHLLAVPRQCDFP